MTATINERDSAELFRMSIEMGRNPGAKPNLHAMIYSYFDDSSDPDREVYFACGGLVASEDRWKNFHVPWAVATIDLSEPFRSTDCECGWGQFKDQSKWPKTKRDNLMAKLVSIIRDARLGGFSTVVPISDYEHAFPDCDEHDAYYLSVKTTIIAMATLGQDERNRLGFGGVECWFENNNATASKTLSIYNRLREVKSWAIREALLSNIHFEDKSLRPLQAADLIARESYKYMVNLGVRQTRKPVKELVNRLNFTVWRRDQLEYLRDNGGPDNLELLTSWEATMGAPPFETHYGMF